MSQRFLLPMKVNLAALSRIFRDLTLLTKLKSLSNLLLCKSQSHINRLIYLKKVEAY